MHSLRPFSVSVFLLVAVYACGGGGFDTCEDTRTCEPDGDGDASTGGTGDGDGDGDGDTGGSTGDGDGDGDTGGTGTGGGTGGNGTGGMGGDPNDPCLECEGDTPHCNPDKECVECLTEDQCSDDEAPVCDTEAGECVECIAAADCEDPALPMCESTACVAGCETANDCTRFGDALNACDVESGTCVQCLTETDCDGNVCNPDTLTCTEIPAGTEFACEECAFDAQCAPGHVCVEMTYDDPTAGVVGSFCLWEKDAGPPLPGPGGTCGLNSRPYPQEAAVTTVDGASATVCRPTTTTCPAVLQHRTTVTGCETPVTDDSACGAAGFNDGRCRENSSSEPRCSYPCLGNEDCPAGSTCPAVGDRFCSL